MNINTFTNFSDSPRHLEISVLADISKKLTAGKVSEASAFPRADFPTPDLLKIHIFKKEERPFVYEINNTN